MRVSHGRSLARVWLTCVVLMIVGGTQGLGQADDGQFAPLITPDPLPPEEVRAPGDPCVPETFLSYVEASTTLKAAFYFPWHEASSDCPANTDWCKCLGARVGNPKPVLQYYDSREPAIANAHLDQLSNHGVDLLGLVWWGPNTFGESAFFSATLPAIDSHAMKFAIVYDLGVRFDIGQSQVINFNNSTVVQTFLADIEYLATHPSYFHHQKYLKFKGKPVLYIYITRAIEGSDENIRAAFDDARDRLTSAGFPGLFLVADHLYWSHYRYDRLPLMSANAVTSFGPVENWQMPARPVREWANRMSQDLYQHARATFDGGNNYGAIDIEPGIFVQYDDSGVNPAEDCDAPGLPAKVYRLVDASDFVHMIRTAGLAHRWVAEKTQVRPTCATVRSSDSDYTSILWTYSFNEWGEGTGLEALEPRTPEFPFGFGTRLLQTFRDTVAAGQPPEIPPPPTLIRPIGVVTGLRPLFLWNGVPNAVEYELEVRDSTGALVFDPRPRMTETSYTPGTELSPGGNYSWTVRASTSQGWGPYAPVENFTVQSIPTNLPGPPTPLEPSGCVGTLRPRFAWVPGTGAVDYKIAISEVSPERLVVYVDVSGTEYVPPVDLLPATAYRWKVKSRNAAGEAWSEELFFATLGDDGCVPVPTEPMGCVFTLRPTFAWLGVDGADTYRVQVYETVSPERLVLDEFVTGTTFVPAGSLVAGRHHRWLVAAKFGDPEAWSVSLSFTPGCGFEDIFWYEDGTGLGLPAWGVFTSSGHDFLYAGNWGYFGQSPLSWMYGGDFNGDGFGDVFFRSESLGRHMFLSDGVQFQDDGMWGPLSWNSVWAAVGDFTGDGKDDVAYREQEAGIRVLRSTGFNFLDAIHWYPAVTTVPTWSGVGDFNGDGLDDLVWYEDGTVPAVGVFFSNGSAFQDQGDWGLFAQERLTAPDFAGTGDFNGDGRDDVIWYRQGEGIQVFVSDGERFVDHGNWLIWHWNPTWAAIGDFTRDGKDDVVWRNEEGGLRLLRSTGYRFIESIGWYSPGLAVPTDANVGNYNGN